MIIYRSFRNTDPPALVRVWNEAFAGRGTVTLRNTSTLEYFLLSKSYFDPAGLIIAEADGTLVGWALSGFASDPQRAGLDISTGVLCALGVVPSHRRRGIGTELLRRCEQYLRERGVQTLLAGPMTPHNPFTFGLYGGCQSPGFLDSNTTLGPFLLKRGYTVRASVLVMQRHLDRPFNIIDARFPALRKRFEVRSLPRRGSTDWYEECVRGPLDYLPFRIEDKGTNREMGRCSVWEMEPFGQNWNESAVGILDVGVEPAMRRQGVARLLLGNVMRFLHDQYFTLVEAHVPADNTAALQLFRGLSFQRVDEGKLYQRR